MPKSESATAQCTSCNVNYGGFDCTMDCKGQIFCNAQLKNDAPDVFAECTANPSDSSQVICPRRVNGQVIVQTCPGQDWGYEMCYYGYWRDIYYSIVPTYEWWKTCDRGCGREDIRKANGTWCDDECPDYHDYDEQYRSHESSSGSHDFWDDDD